MTMKQRLISRREFLLLLVSPLSILACGNDASESLSAAEATATVAEEATSSVPTETESDELANLANTEEGVEAIEPDAVAVDRDATSEPVEFLVLFGRRGADGVTEATLANYTSTFDRIDANDDGIVSAEEYVASGHFPEATARAINAGQDFNKDGKVTVEEYIEHRIETDEGKEIMFAMDTNGDELLTLAELTEQGPLDATQAETLYSNQLDANNDGQITVPEWLGTWGQWVWGNWIGETDQPASSETQPDSDATPRTRPGPLGEQAFDRPSFDEQCAGGPQETITIESRYSLAAEMIGITTDEIIAAVEAGTSIASLATDTGTDPATIIEAAISQAEARITGLVDQGQMPTNLADNLLADMPQRVAAFINDTPNVLCPDL